MVDQGETRSLKPLPYRHRIPNPEKEWHASRPGNISYERRLDSPQLTINDLLGQLNHRRIYYFK